MLIGEKRRQPRRHRKRTPVRMSHRILAKKLDVVDGLNESEYGFTKKCKHCQNICVYMCMFPFLTMSPYKYTLLIVIC